jgi:hypothetical protein
VWLKALGCCGYGDDEIVKIMDDLALFHKNDAVGCRKTLHYMMSLDFKKIASSKRMGRGFEHLRDARDADDKYSFIPEF